MEGYISIYLKPDYYSDSNFTPTTEIKISLYDPMIIVFESRDDFIEI
jgi:hypothetical protein